MVVRGLRLFMVWFSFGFWFGVNACRWICVIVQRFGFSCKFGFGLFVVGLILLVLHIVV